MTVKQSTYFARIAISGTTASVNVPFRFEPGSLSVKVRTAAAPDPVALTYGIDFTTTGGDQESGGVVTFATALTVTGNVDVERVTPAVQDSPYREASGFSLSQIEASLDRLAMRVQEIAGAAMRTLRLPASDPASDPLPEAAARANGQLWFDALGKPFVAFATIALAGVSSFVNGLLSAADAGAFRSQIGAAAVADNKLLIYGLESANASGDPVNDVLTNAGGAMDSTGAVLMVLGAALTKQIDAAWAAGDNAGALDQGAVANGTYHRHLIMRPDTGQVDLIDSLSHDEAAVVTMTIASPCVVSMDIGGRGHGLVAGAPIKFTTTGALPTGLSVGTQYFVSATGLTKTTYQVAATNGGASINTSGVQSGVHTCRPGPLLPANYTYFRRILSYMRASAANRLFKQVKDYFAHANATTGGVQDWSQNTTGTAAVTRTHSVPTGIPIEAVVNLVVNGAGGSTKTSVTDLATPDLAPDVPVGIYLDTPSTVTNGVRGHVMTDRSAQTRSRATVSGATITQVGATIGWFDRIGRR